MNQKTTVNRTRILSCQENHFILLTLAMVFSLQMLRELQTHLCYNYTLSYTNIPLLVTLTFGTFLAGLLAKPLVWCLGYSGTIMLSIAGISVSRVGVQVTTNPTMDLIGCMLGVALFLVLMSVLLGVYRTNQGSWLAAVMSAGFAIDTAIHGILETYGLVWREDRIALTAVVILALLQFILLIDVREDLTTSTEGSAHSIFPLIGWPYVILLNGLFFQNIPFLMIVSGLTSGAAFGVVSLGNIAVLALLVLCGNPLRKAGWQLSTIVSLGFVGLVVLFPSGWFAIPLFLLGQLYMGSALSAQFSARRQTNDARVRIGQFALVNAISAITFSLVTALYYVAYVIPLPVSNTMLLTLSAVVVAISTGIGVWRSDTSDSVSALSYRGLMRTAVILAMFPLLFGVAIAPQFVPTPGPQPDPTNEVRVITYNLRNGFSVTGQVSMVALANNISAQDPDIVALQEVSRGWIIDGAFDMVPWLQNTLDMPYAVFQPTAGPLWGNLLLSRYPILQHESVEMPLDLPVMRRGFIWAEIDLGEKRLAIIATHLHHLGGEEHSAIRVKQAESILTFAETHPAHIVLGDFNAAPGTAEMNLFTEAGWLNAQDEIGFGQGYTFASNAPGVRIDWIYAQPDITFSDLVIGGGFASDHLFVATTVTLP